MLSRCANVYFCHHGTVQHKIGWFTPVPGVVHCNRAMLAATPAVWVAAQSEIAVPPLYLSPDIIGDADDTAGTGSEFAHLLRHENYTFMNIPAAVNTFFTHAGDANFKASREDIMTLTEEAWPAGPPARRPATPLHRFPRLWPGRRPAIC
jgi:hypothetical protein